MMPMVFCASLPPWPSEYKDAEPNCKMRKRRSTAYGVLPTNAQDTAKTRTSASKNPTAGEMIIAAVVLSTPPHTVEARPALAIPAPKRPPIRAWELLDGMPAHQVIRFQEIAPI